MEEDIDDIEDIRLLRPDLPVSKHGENTPEGALRAKNEIEKWLKENPQPIGVYVSITNFNTLRIEYSVMLGGDYYRYYLDVDGALEEFKKRLREDLTKFLFNLRL